MRTCASDLAAALFVWQNERETEGGRRKGRGAGSMQACASKRKTESKAGRMKAVTHDYLPSADSLAAGSARQWAQVQGYAIRADYEADLVSSALLHLSQWLNTGSPRFSCCGSLCACSGHGRLIKCLKSWTGGKGSSFNYSMSRRVERERESEWCCVVLHCGQRTPGTRGIIGKYHWSCTPGLAWAHA